jgi:hypothetical protein
MGDVVMEMDWQHLSRNVPQVVVVLSSVGAVLEMTIVENTKDMTKYMMVVQP